MRCLEPPANPIRSNDNLPKSTSCIFSLVVAVIRRHRRVSSLRLVRYDQFLSMSTHLQTIVCYLTQRPFRYICPMPLKLFFAKNIITARCSKFSFNKMHRTTELKIPRKRRTNRQPEKNFWLCANET